MSTEKRHHRSRYGVHRQLLWGAISCLNPITLIPDGSPSPQATFSGNNGRKIRSVSIVGLTRTASSCAYTDYCILEQFEFFYRFRVRWVDLFFFLTILRYFGL